MKKNEEKELKEEKKEQEVKEQKEVKETSEEKEIKEEEQIEEIVAATEEEKEENKEKKEKRNFYILVMIFIVLLIIAFALVVIAVKLEPKESESDNKKPDTEEKEDEEEEDEEEEELNPPVEDPVPDEEKKNQLTIYCDKVTCSDKKENEYFKEMLTIPTESADAKYLDTTKRMYDEKQKGYYILYEDNNKVKLYDIVSKISTITSLKTGYEKYDVIDDETKVLGIGYFSDKKEINYSKTYNISGFYNLATGKVLYENRFDFFSYVNDELIGGSKLISDNENEENYEHELLSITKEKTYIKSLGEQPCYYQMIGNNNYMSFYRNPAFAEAPRDIYTKDYELIAEKVGPYSYSFDEENNLLIAIDNKIIKYNTKGTKIKETEKYDKVLHVFKDINLVVLNNKLIIVDNKDNTKTTLREWNDSYHYHSMISGYYEAGSLSNANEKDAGYYFIIETDRTTAKGVEYYYNPETKEVKTYDLPQIGGYAKPVLYLYPEETTNVKVYFEHNDNLTTTYPKFKNYWEVTANPNGDLYDKDGKYYYGLYWEEDLNHKVDFNEGFYVTKDNAIEFLEEKLTYIGLSDKERNEFIMYWLPILEKNEQSLVYFELTNERENFNKIIIEPTPKSLLRMAIHVKKVDKEVNIKEQKLVPFNRSGFTAVEWGGIIY